MSATVKGKIPFAETVQFRAPSGFTDAIRSAAARHFTSPSEWARQRILAALKADGIRVPSGDEERG